MRQAHPRTLTPGAKLAQLIKVVQVSQRLPQLFECGEALAGIGQMRAQQVQVMQMVDDMLARLVEFLRIAASKPCFSSLRALR